MAVVFRVPLSSVAIEIRSDTNDFTDVRESLLFCCHSSDRFIAIRSFYFNLATLSCYDLSITRASDDNVEY